MFGVGFSELLLLGLIVGLLIGPDQLPHVIKGLSKFLREITKAKDELEQAVDEDETLRTFKNSVGQAKRMMDAKVYDVRTRVTDHINSVKDPLKKSIEGEVSSIKSAIEPKLPAEKDV